MSFEGTTNPVVVDTSASAAPEVEVNASPETEVAETPEAEEGTEGEQPEVTPRAEDLEEIEFEGEKIKVPKKIKEGLLRQADYTRKTQETAELRKSLESRLESAGTVHKDYVNALADVKACDAQLKRYENVDWATLEATDPAAASSHWRNFSQLKDARTTAEKTANEKQHALAMESDRARGTRLQEVVGTLKEILPEWAPDNEFEQKLAKFGTAHGLSKQDIAEATLRNPAFLKIVNLARIGAEYQTKEANTKRIAAAQAVRPAAEIGSRSSTTTKDPEKMSQAQYVKWRAAQG